MTTCELCGSKVRIVGDTTKHYEPVIPDCSMVHREDSHLIVEQYREIEALHSKLDIAVKVLQDVQMAPHILNKENLAEKMQALAWQGLIQIQVGCEEKK